MMWPSEYVVTYELERRGYAVAVGYSSLELLMTADDFTNSKSKTLLQPSPAWKSYPPPSKLCSVFLSLALLQCGETKTWMMRWAWVTIDETWFRTRLNVLHSQINVAWSWCAVHCPLQIVTTRSSERGDAAFNHRNLRLGDGSDGHTIVGGQPVSSSICGHYSDPKSQNNPIIHLW
jgi:hypothetical protein